MAPNRYHCSSSQAFELTPNTLRTTALMALTRTTIRVSQVTALPTAVLMRSIKLDRRNKNCMALLRIWSRSGIACGWTRKLVGPKMDWNAYKKKRLHILYD